jgi:isopenicillin N synthase-like dioxygenase
MPDTIPRLDVTGLAAHDPAVIARLAGEIGAAARGLGFFLVTGHGIPESLIGAVQAQSRAFFARPVAEKAEVALTRSPHNRGWVGLGGEALDPKTGADQKEAFNIGLDFAPDHPEVLAGAPFRGVNLWPDLPGFRETMLAYYDACWRLGRDLHRPIARDLGLADEWFEDKLDAPLAILRLLRYPPAGSVTGEVGAGTHTDYGNLTLLHTEEAGSLEVQARDGRWIKAPHVPGAFIVNIGDCLMRWTNDVYVSTPHRVLHESPRERLSLAFFLDPDPDADVRALPSCVSATRPAKYPPISGAAYLKERLDATYAHRRAS